MIRFDNLSIVLGIIFLIITLIIRVIKLKSKFFDRSHLVTFLGYCIFSFTTAIMIGTMSKLLYFTWTDQLTQEMILQNKPYIFLGWALIGLSGLIAYISLLVENKTKD
ncbi:MAG: hypothetical protein Q8N99_00185 [Nanoarchaeota archaeon]|nr:hypothetical protein [Nanoarchaeota archaeon]